MKIEIWAIKYWQKILESAFLDKQLYLQAYPDIRKAGVDPSYHYLIKGVKVGAVTGPYLSSTKYLAAPQDVAKAKMNPLLN